MQIQAILTQLIFNHALRIRIKSETSGDTAIPQDSPVTDLGERSESPDSADDISETQTAVSEGTAASKAGQAKKSSTLSDASTSTANAAADKNENDGNQTKNLTGKLNNLVTSDLSNITSGRDFLFVGVLDICT